MTATMRVDILTAARAEALFCAPICSNEHLTLAAVEAIIRQQLRRCGGVRGCAETVALEYGDHPDTAAARMRWARNLVDTLYARKAA